MKFEYTGRHIDVTPALRSHVENHFERINHLFNGKPAKVHVIIEVERGRHRSEVVLNWRNDVLTATTSNSDMYASLSQTIDKIEKQALKLKNKVIDKSHRAKFSRNWNGIWTDELVSYALSDVCHLPRLMTEQIVWLEKLGLIGEFETQLATVARGYHR